ncbi:hypothetical protein C7212DRAFT_340056 [Tuber magnatum]|uniref:Uncharacterized protein n=1 Tax=Tuber magnatum TaxID=42249 RepID=A0A317T094_9PEZI|nr:hypothetical protein C7212DRAFT_340056 [Tuber magnatum]
MPAILLFPVRALTPMYNKRDYTANEGGDDGDGKSLVVIVGVVIAGLTLLVGVMALRSPRFRRFASYLLPSRCVNALCCDPPPEAPRIPTADSAVPVIHLHVVTPSIPMPNPLPPPIETPPHWSNHIPYEDVRVTGATGLPELRGPERVATWPGVYTVLEALSHFVSACLSGAPPFVSVVADA